MTAWKKTWKWWKRLAWTRSVSQNRPGVPSSQKTVSLISHISIKCLRRLHATIFLSLSGHRPTPSRHGCQKNTRTFWLWPITVRTFMVQDRIWISHTQAICSTASGLSAQWWNISKMFRISSDFSWTMRQKATALPVCVSRQCLSII